MLSIGKNAVRELLDSDKKINKLYVLKGAHDLDKIVEGARSKGARVEFSDKKVLDKLAGELRHQGVIAETSDFEYCTLDDILLTAKKRGEKTFILLLDGIEDPHNLGSILRVAECAGVHGVVIPARRSASVNETVIRISAGAANHVAVAKVGNINDAIRKLKDEFVNVCCADMGGESIYDAHFDEDTAIVIGSEGFGVKELTAKLCDKTVAIPQRGKVNSLNASVACGIICYEVVRQRYNK